MAGKLFFSCLAVMLGVAFAAEFKMDKAMGNCGETINVRAGEQAFVTASGDAPATCTLTVQSEVIDNCEGVCINFKEADFTSCEVSLTASGSADQTMEFGCKNRPSGPWCTKESRMTLNLVQTASYKPEPVGYNFRASVYDRCTHGDGGKSPTFEEAAANLDGYHHAEEFDDRVRTSYITGICLGFGLSCIFLVILLIAFCYVKNNPNRGDRQKTDDIAVVPTPKQPQLQKHVVTKF